MTLITPLTVSIAGDGGFAPDAEVQVRFEPRPEQAAGEAAALETP
jgi:hypothetical protein